MIIISSCIENQNYISELKFENQTGPYIGQQTPDTTATVFAPGLISTAMYTRDLTMTPDGKEIYFCVSSFGYNLIFVTRQKDGHWTEPVLASFIEDPKYIYYEPHITPDGKKLLFLSNMPAAGDEEASEDIWAVDRNGEGWGKAYNLGAPVNTDGAEFFPSTTLDGTLYFTRAAKDSRLNHIYRSKYADGKYQEPEQLGPEVNCGVNRYNAFIDPDERFIIVPAVGMEDGYGGTDYYVVFRDENDQWSKPVNMGPQLNTKSGGEYSASLSPDGKYLFFMSNRPNPKTSDMEGRPSFKQLHEAFNKPQNGNADIYWIRADFIMTLKK